MKFWLLLWYVMKLLGMHLYGLLGGTMKVQKSCGMVGEKLVVVVVCVCVCEGKRERESRARHGVAYFLLYYTTIFGKGMVFGLSLLD